MNTRITYLYRDACNNKQSESIVVSGELLFAQIKPYLDEGEYFIPGQIGLDDLQPRFGKLITGDHPWHKLHEEDVEQTEDSPTNSLTAYDLLERFREVQWDERQAEQALGIPE